MFFEHEPLQPLRAQDQPLQAIQADAVKPAQYRRPAAPARAGLLLVRQSAPQFGRARVVLDMVTVVEEKQIVEPAVVAGRAACVLEVSLQLAQSKADEP